MASSESSSVTSAIIILILLKSLPVKKNPTKLYDFVAVFKKVLSKSSMGFVCPLINAYGKS